MTAFNEKLCLMFDPFAGDFEGDGNDQILSNKIVTVRKERECSNCFRKVKKGTRARVQTEIYDGKLHCATFCQECCIAMAKDDDGEAYIDRHESPTEGVEG